MTERASIENTNAISSVRGRSVQADNTAKATVATYSMLNLSVSGRACDQRIDSTAKLGISQTSLGPKRRQDRQALP